MHHAQKTVMALRTVRMIIMVAVARACIMRCPKPKERRLTGRTILPSFLQARQAATRTPEQKQAQGGALGILVSVGIGSAPAGTLFSAHEKPGCFDGCEKQGGFDG